MKENTKLQGFKGEVRIVVPPSVIGENIDNELFNLFYITDIGYYPKAKNHFCKRKEGSPEHILIHCVDGKGKVTVSKRDFELKANYYIILPANEYHRYQADERDPWTIYWMHFKGQQCQYIVDKLTKRVLEHDNVLPFDNEIKFLFKRFCDLLAQGYSKEIMEFIALNLPYYFSGYLYPSKFKILEFEDLDEVDKSITFLKDKIGEKIKVAQIADYVHLSVSHFCKLFKTRTGYSPIEYFNHLKIQKACYLLQFSEKRVSSISFELGFDDQYYFSRLFKKYMGYPPTTYRERVKS